MKLLILAPVAALLFTLVSLSSAAAENWEPGFVIHDAPCYPDLGDATPVLNLASNQELLIDVDSRTDGWVRIQYEGEAQLQLCWVDEYFVSVGQGRPIEDDVPFDDPFPILGENVVNDDGVNCRVGPALSAPVTTVLGYGELVQERADGVTDGWQMVTLSEGTTCYVAAEFLGIQPGEVSDAANPDEGVWAAAPPDYGAADSVIIGNGTEVKALPNTGYGTESATQKEQLKNAEPILSWFEFIVASCAVALAMTVVIAVWDWRASSRR